MQRTPTRIIWPKCANVCGDALFLASHLRAPLQVVEACGRALLAGRSIHYVSESDEHGVLGQIDASECPPTYGALPTDVVGHLRGGGSIAVPPEARVTIALACTSADAQWTLPCPPGVSLLALKLQLNVVSSGAHVMRGKIYGNRMMDLRLANNKLFYRGIGIVEAISGCDAPTARRLLLRALDVQDDGGDDPAVIGGYVAVAMRTPRVVPLAVLLGKGLARPQAEALLDRQPVLRLAIKEAE